MCIGVFFMNDRHCDKKKKLKHNCFSEYREVVTFYRIMMNICVWVKYDSGPYKYINFSF